MPPYATKPMKTFELSWNLIDSSWFDQIKLSQQIVCWFQTILAWFFTDCFGQCDTTYTFMGNQHLSDSVTPWEEPPANFRRATGWPRPHVMPKMRVLKVELACDVIVSEHPLLLTMVMQFSESGLSKTPKVLHCVECLHTKIKTLILTG